MEIKTSYLIMDNDGENQSLITDLLYNEFDTQVEMTSQDTPHHNRIVERVYQNLYNCICAMMNGTGI